MSRSVGRAVILAGLALSVNRVAAQSAEERLALGRFRDSLASIADTAGLRRLEAELMLAAKRDRSNTSRHLSLGFLALRLGEYDDAAAEFKWATRLESQWSYAWFGLGLAELGLGRLADTSRAGRHALLSRDAWNRAITAFARATALDPALGVELERLVGTILADGDPAPARVVRDGLRRGFTATRDKTAALALALGRTERMVGDTTAALAAFAAAAALPAGRGPGLYEQARIHLIRGDQRGLQAYFDAIAVDDSATLAAIRGDLAWVATAQELARFDGESGRERAQVAWQVWTNRDRRDLRRTGERLAEHYRRLDLVRRRYPNPVDQRARVFVRHGDPDSRAAAEFQGIGRNESWWFRRPEGDLVAHFVSRDGSRYDLVESIFDLAVEVTGPTAAGGDAMGGPVDLTDALLRSRARLSPFYQAGAASRREQLANFKARERALGQAGLREALTTDRFPLAFARELTARYRLLGLAGDSVRSGLYLFFTIPGFALAKDGASATREHPVRVRLVVWDSAGRAVRAVDSTLSVAAPAQGPPRADGYLSVPVEAGLYAARVAIETGDGSGLLGDRDRIRVGPVPNLVTLSDLMVAGASGGIAAGVGSGRVDPGGLLSRRDTMIATAEIYGTAGSSGRVRALVRRRPTEAEPNPKWQGFPGRDRWVPLSVDDLEGGVVRMALPLSRLKLGGYEVEVVFVDGAGRTARTRASFDVEDEKPADAI